MCVCVCVCDYTLGCLGDDDVGLHVLGCRVDILGTNCNGCLGVECLNLYAFKHAECYDIVVDNLVYSITCSWLFYGRTGHHSVSAKTIQWIRH